MATARQQETNARLADRLSLNGRQQYTPISLTEQWKARANNERTGLPNRENSGANAGIALTWCPESDLHLTEARPRGCRKKASELRLVYDFGYRRGLAEERAGLSTAPSVVGTKPPQARAGSPGTESQGRRHARSQLDDEVSVAGSLTESMQQEIRAVRARELELVRVSRAAELRKNGELFLRAGNLKEAKAHFKQAEALLQMTANKYAMHRQALNATAQYRLTGQEPTDSFL